jgi:chondroitin AC lyase
MSDAKVEGWMKTLGPDGSWPDIDYASQNRSGWPAAGHVGRLAAMAIFYAKTKIEGHPDEDLLATITRGLDYWLDHSFHSDNWWFNTIGVPNDLTDTMLMIEDNLTADEKAKGLQMTAQHFIDPATGKYKMTGQNLVWCAAVAFKNALLMNDAAAAKQQHDIIVSEIKQTTEEGLQADQSFHQHGPQPQMGNYGLSYLATMSDLAWMWRGTSFALDDEKLSLIRRFSLEGEALVTANKSMDISACGRQISPHSPASKGFTVLTQLDLMAEVDAAHASDYKTAIAQDSAATGCGDPALPGGRLDKLFYRSDYLVHRRPDFFASVKLSSRRIIGEENTNQENQLGRYLSDGALFVYRDSREYADIFPVWNWRRIPGVTCASQGGSLVPAGRMDTDFAGGVSDGTYGAAGLDYNRDGVTGRKSWFFLDHEIVCLGAGLTSKDNSTLTTAVEQCLLNGPVTAGSAGAHWFWHNGEGYIFPGKQNVALGSGKQSGSWHDVFITGSKDPISKDVFSLWIDHGVEPVAAEYVYIIVPVSTKEETAAWAAAPSDTVLSNTSGAQAIENAHLKLAMAFFFQPGQITCQLGTVSVDAPCALILNEDAAHPRVTVADPSQLGAKVQVTIAGKAVAVNLPQAEEAGKSVSADLK